MVQATVAAEVVVMEINITEAVAVAGTTMITTVVVAVEVAVAQTTTEEDAAERFGKCMPKKKKERHFTSVPQFA